MGTLCRVGPQASDLRGHWAYKGEDGVGSALILRLRQNQTPGLTKAAYSLPFSCPRAVLDRPQTRPVAARRPVTHLSGKASGRDSASRADSPRPVNPGQLRLLVIPTQEAWAHGNTEHFAGERPAHKTTHSTKPTIISCSVLAIRTHQLGYRKPQRSRWTNP